MPRPKSDAFQKAIDLLQEGHTLQEVVARGIAWSTAYRAREYLQAGGSPMVAIAPVAGKKKAAPIDETQVIDVGKGATEVRTKEGTLTHVDEAMPDFYQALTMTQKVLRMPFPHYLVAGIMAAHHRFGWPLNIRADDFIDTVIKMFFQYHGMELAGPGAFYEPRDIEELYQMYVVNRETGEIKSYVGGEEDAIQERPADTTPGSDGEEGGGKAENEAGANTSAEGEPISPKV